MATIRHQITIGSGAETDSRDKQTLIPYIRFAQKYNPELTFWISPWCPPSWMKINGDYPVQSSKYNHLSADADVALYLGTINTNRYDYINMILSDLRLRQNIQGIGFQWEGGQTLSDIHAKYPQLKVVQTENECGWGSFDRKAGEHTFGLMNHYLGNGCEEYTFWNTILDDKGESPWGWKQNALIRINSEKRTATFTPEYYAVKHYSNSIVPGTRILTGSSAKENKTPVLVCLIPRNKLIIVAGNFNDDVKDVSIKLGNRYLNISLHPHSFNTFKER